MSAIGGIIIVLKTFTKEVCQPYYIAPFSGCGIIIVLKTFTKEVCQPYYIEPFSGCG